MKNFIDFLSKTEFGIYWYCVIMDSKKELCKVLNKKSIFAWFLLVGNIIAAINEMDGIVDFVSKFIMAILKFLA